MYKALERLLRKEPPIVEVESPGSIARAQLDQLTKVIEQNPENVTVMLALAKTHCLLLDLKQASMWLNKAISSPQFDPNCHKIELSIDQFSLLNIDLLTPRAIQAFFLKLIELPPTYFSGYRELRQVTDLQNVKRLKSIIEKALVSDLDGKAAFAVIGFYKKFRSDFNFSTSQIQSWIQAAKPVIEAELVKLPPITEQESDLIAQKLPYIDVLPKELETRRDFIEKFAPYNEQCAHIYLNWHLKGNHHYGERSAETLLSCARHFHTLLPAIMTHHDFSKSTITFIEGALPEAVEQLRQVWQEKPHNYGDILIIKENDPVLCEDYRGKRFRYHLCGRDKQNQPVQTIELAPYLEGYVLPRRGMFASRVEDHEVSNVENSRDRVWLLCLNSSLDTCNFAPSEELHFLYRIYKLKPEDDLELPWGALDSIISEDLRLRLLSHPQRGKISKDVCLRWASESVHVCKLLLSYFNGANVIGLEPSDLFEAVTKHSLHLSALEIKTFLEVLKIDERIVQVDSFNTTTPLIKILRNQPTLKPQITQILIAYLREMHVEMVINLLSTNLDVLADSMQQLIERMSFASSSHPVLVKYSEFIVSNREHVNLKEIITKQPRLALPILRLLLAYNFLSFEEQIHLAKDNLEAAEHYFILIQNRAFTNFADVQLATWLKIIGLAQPSLALKCGLECLEMLQFDAAHELLNSVTPTNSGYHQAQYECANIQFCFKNDKLAARSHLERIPKESDYFHATLTASTFFTGSVPITDIYKRLVTQKSEETIAIEGTTSLFDIRSAHHLLGNIHDKKITPAVLEQVVSWYRNSLAFYQRESEAEKCVIERAGNPILNDTGRYRVLRDFMFANENANSNFRRFLPEYFGETFFKQDSAKPTPRLGST